MRPRAHVLRRFGAVLVKSPKYAFLAANLARDGRLTVGQRLGAVACMGYVFSPVDLVPGIIPIAGQLDDLAVLIGGLKLVLKTVPPPVGLEQLGRAGLSARDVDEDLRTVGDTAAWLGRQGSDRVGQLVSAARRLVGLESAG